MNAEHAYEFTLIDDPDALTTRDVCKILRVSRSTVVKLIASNKLPARMIDGKYYVAKIQLLTYMYGSNKEKQKEKSSNENTEDYNEEN